MIGGLFYRTSPQRTSDPGTHPARLLEFWVKDRDLGGAGRDRPIVEGGLFYSLARFEKFRINSRLSDQSNFACASHFGNAKLI